MRNLLLLLILAGGAYYLWQQSQGFDDDGVQQVKDSITREYEKKSGVKVEEVSLIKSAARELKGFVRIKDAALKDSYTLSCSANTDEKQERFLWRCGR